jgi:hypothetical protein
MADYVLYGLSVGLVDPDPYYQEGVLAENPIFLSSSVEGSIGFRYEGGIITVDATSPSITVSFDRLMQYDGSYSPVPSGQPYNIGAPSLALDTKSIAIPITVPSQILATPSYSIFDQRIDITWSEVVELLSTDGWYISDTGGSVVPVSVQAFGGSGSTIQVYTSEHTAGATYTLHIPPNRVFGASGKPNALLTHSFIGVATPPTIYTTQFETVTSVLVTFSEPMSVSSASNASHYSIPGLSIYGVTPISSNQFRLNTSMCVPGQSYTLTVTGVLDAAGNPIL